MCDCNCASDRVDYWFPGPDGTVYGLQIDPGCDNCQRPCVLAGVRIFQITEQEWPHYGDENTPRLRFSPDEHGRFVPVVDADSIGQKIISYATEDKVTGGQVWEDYIDTEDIASGGVDSLIRDALSGYTLSDAVIATHNRAVAVSDLET
jgi:hypothetical protein